MESMTLRELEAEAGRRLEPAIADYFAGGAGDEWTVRANESAYARIGLVPRVLCDAGDPDLSTTLFGQRISMPVLVAPTAFHRLAHPDGECATARAAHAADTILIAAMASTEAIENVAAAGNGKLWFQLYLQPDRIFMESLVRRVEAAGCTALVVTVDSPVFGKRERDARNGFTDLPAGMCCENLRDADSEPGSPVRRIVFSTALSWKDVEWLRTITRLTILLKGVVRPADARIALECGVDGLIVSNHGGRQLDTIPATIELLPDIVDAVGGAVPVLVDGGIRRGTDVVKALALGATAVAIGRPVLWGLAIDGADGAASVLHMLRVEVESALALCGCGSPKELNRDFLRFERREETWRRH
jgi:4-hydroxymandelate oxidase